MSLTMEVAELFEKPSIVYDVAEKVSYNLNLSAEEKEIYEISDTFVRNVGKTGLDSEKLIAAFITKTVNEEIYNAPDELLDQIFDRGTTGEFDQTEYQKDPKNTLEVHFAAKGGNVDRSYIDFAKIAPITRNAQVESDLSYVDMRKNGFKSVALITTYMKEALQNALFYDTFSLVDTAIIGGDQITAVSGSVPIQSAWDKLSMYLLDRDPNAVAIGLSKYTTPLARMQGRTQFISDSMKDNFNRYGLVDFVDGVRVATIKTSRRTGKNQLLLPDMRIFGVAGKIGALDMRGEIHTYENNDDNKEVIHLMCKDFSYDVAITNIENCFKMTFTS